MWCAKCQSDVAVEARANSQQLFCTNCGTEIRPHLIGNHPRGVSPPPDDATGETPVANPPAADPPPRSPLRPPHSGRTPQDLLARWAGEKMLDPYGPIVPPERPASAKPLPPEPTRPFEPDRMQRLRVDSANSEGWNEIPPPHHSSKSGRPHQPLPPGPRKLTGANVPPNYRADSGSGLRGPHFNPVPQQNPEKSINWIARIGTMLAYLGAATLTFGAGMVLVGYLGGPTHYAPTGWFTTTVGQMLLFLGVVTLVSAGMEQTTVEVSKRIDTLGSQLERIEIAAGNFTDSTSTENELRAEIAELRRQLGQSN